MTRGGLLAASGLTKRYGGTLANDAVDITLAPGEMRGLIGPNGAGKTTLINLLSGLELPDSGRIHLDGVDVTARPPHRIAAAGLVRTFQVARTFPSLSVRENLIVPFLAAGGPGGIGGGLLRADELMTLAALHPLANEPASVLSGGQRVLLQACASFMIPSVRLHVFDEPFAGINPLLKDTLMALIERENAGSGRAFLIVSHEMEIVRRLCPRVTVMINGRVAAEGALEEIARNPEVIGAYLGRASA